MNLNSTSVFAFVEDEYDAESAAPRFTQQELEDLQDDLSEYEGSDLSEGEIEEDQATGGLCVLVYMYVHLCMYVYLYIVLFCTYI